MDVAMAEAPAPAQPAPAPAPAPAAANVIVQRQRTGWVDEAAGTLKLKDVAGQRGVVRVVKPTRERVAAR